jgi:phosphate transport system permease protein
MDANNKHAASRLTAADRQRPLFVTVVTILLVAVAIAAIVGGILLSVPAGEGALSSLQTRLGVHSEEGGMSSLQILLAAVILAALSTLLARGMWTLQNWARTAVMLLLGAIGLYYGLTVVFDAAAEIFGGEQVVPVSAILGIVLNGLLGVVATGIIPSAIIYALISLGAHFEESPGQRAFIDRGIRYVLIATALSAVFIVFLIILFTLAEAWEAIEQIGLKTMLLGTIWRPGSIIGTEEAQFGLVPMIVGSILATFGAVVLGVPLSIGTAILLAEVAPPLVREIVRPAVELLAGIPSVVYGLFGMVVLAPLIRKIEVPYNTGFGLLNASIILAVMIMPTVTNIAEDAIRAVPRHYKEGSLALGTTHWQTIRNVMLPAARSGIIAAIILGIGRALGETMAVIMVIGNSIAIPKPLTSNPLTLFLSSARTLTGNVAVEINYAAGAHRSALFFTGVLLFLMILLVNSLARYLMRERLSS